MFHGVSGIWLSLRSRKHIPMHGKKWNYESLPMIPEEWQTEVKSGTAAQYKVLKELMHDARVDSVVCATDENKKGETQHKLHLPRL